MNKTINHTTINEWGASLPNWERVMAFNPISGFWPVFFEDTLDFDQLRTKDSLCLLFEEYFGVKADPKSIYTVEYVIGQWAIKNRDAFIQGRFPENVSRELIKEWVK